VAALLHSGGEMETVPETLAIESLLAESKWVGGLALSLVGDSHEAEDLAQDVWLAALRRTPNRHDSPRPWLATVARNAARMLRRSDGARRDREGARARELGGATSASPEELASRHESQELVLGLVRGLPEDLADVISLAFLEGLSSKELARCRGLEPGTVRQRKKRALALLRERLDAHCGGERSVWLSTLAPLAVTWSRRRAKGLATGGALTATPTPWLRMALTWKAASLLFALVSVAVAFMVGGGDELPLELDPTVASAVAPAADLPVISEGSAPLVTRVMLRVVDEAGGPIAGAIVRAVPSAALGSAHRDAVSKLDAATLVLLQASPVRTTTGTGEVSWETDFLLEAGTVWARGGADAACRHSRADAHLDRVRRDADRECKCDRRGGRGVSAAHGVSEWRCFAFA
jgi:RNA polymerase sigma-70 factor (ECF subfamily)